MAKLTESQLNDAYERAGIKKTSDANPAPPEKISAVNESEPIFKKNMILLEQIRDTERQILEELENQDAMDAMYQRAGIRRG